MSDQSAIEWTDATWNPTTGCTKVSPGCAHCYIERTPAFRIAGNKFEHGKTDLTIFHDRLEQPLHWRKPRRIFVNSLSDLFHEDISDAFIDRVFAVMALAPQHTFQVLTKRSERMRAYLSNPGVHLNAAEASEGFDVGEVKRTWPLSNVWLGVSVENQHFADERIPLLLKTPAAVRFISAEPLLGDVSLLRYMRAPGPPNPPASTRNYLDWVIVGGESGPQSRPFDIAWARSIIFQGKLARVPVFVKQLGSNPAPIRVEAGSVIDRLWLRDRKGGNPDEWPADLRVREYPASTWNSPPRGGVAET